MSRPWEDVTFSKTRGVIVGRGQSARSDWLRLAPDCRVEWCLPPLTAYVNAAASIGSVRLPRMGSSKPKRTKIELEVLCWCGIADGGNTKGPRFAMVAEFLEFV